MGDIESNRPKEAIVADRDMRDKATRAYCSCCKEDGVGRDINCKQDSEECPFAQRFVKILDD